MKRNSLITVCIVLFSYLLCTEGYCQKDEDSSAQQAKAIAAVHAKTKTAISADDFTVIVDECTAMLEAGELSKTNSDYVKSLLAWAHDKRGVKRLEVIELLLGAKNDVQAAEVFDSAYQDFSTAKKLNPEDWKVLLHEGVLFATMSRYEQAAKCFTKVIEKQPKHLTALFNRAECFYELGEYQKSLEDYSNLVELSPGDMQAITGRAHSLMQLGQHDKALEEYNLIIRLKPGDAWAYANRAGVYQAMEQFEKASKDFSKALEIQSDADIYRHIALMYATSSDDEYFRPLLAIDLAQKAIDMDGKTALRLDVLARAFAASGQFDQASKFQKEAIEMADGDKSPMTTRLSMYEKGEFDVDSLKR